ncbi:uncharacterized protein N7515_000477 [Penicillium bovifimosum]|uniref:Uncharacterized protein n=1 Tax=Penicillium bovifimosum TaxID=126998 RepID=A0A9W9LBL5_9EURO|nr:uncharacterized protein N7515_000477 [Penicillium bovifimosum]KAJ5145913.1 hypothetical protein N7515_000477 [Penicillium bovifimosum]
MSGYYEVYLARYNLEIQNPDMQGPRYHTAIFVKTAADKSGTLHHVTGDITSMNGMVYIPQPRQYPEYSQSFHSLEKLGVTPMFKHPADWGAYRRRPADGVQHQDNENRAIEDPALTFYEPGEPRRPLVKCTEWTLEGALPALQANGLIIQQ